MGEGTIAVSDADYDGIMNDNEWVLVDFWAPWCGPCKMIGPVLEQIAGERDNLVIAKVNTDTDSMNAAKLGVRGIPFLALYNNGEKIDHKSGNMPKDALDTWLDSHMN